MRMIVILLGTALVTFSLALRAEWQWNRASAEDYEEDDQASAAIWSDEDCEAISEAAGLYLYLSGDAEDHYLFIGNEINNRMRCDDQFAGLKLIHDAGTKQKFSLGR